MAPGPACRTSRWSECIEMEADFSAQRGVAVAAIAADAGHDLLVLVHHERRRFPERVRYLTSPGFGTGRGWRETVGLVRGGPGRVITSLGVFGFDPESGEMVLESLHPGVALEELRAETGWPVRVAPDLRETPGPTRAELDAIRRFDPDGLWTG